MAEVELLSLSDAGKWREYLKMLPNNQQDIYFTPEYYRLYENLCDGKAQCFVFRQGKHLALYPFLINSVNDLGFELDQEYFDIQGAYGYNGVISSSYDPEFISAFYHEFNQWCSETNVIAEFTRFHPLLNNQQFSATRLNTVFDRNTIFLDLSKEYDNIWNHEFSSINRNMIRKAEKSGVVSYVSHDNTDYESFFDLYVETMQNVGAIDYYYFNKKYFENIKKGLRNNHFLVVSSIDNKFVGGMILFFCGYYAHYHLSARKKEFGRYAINNHFLNFAIKIALEKGCKVFHFGGGTGNDENDPLFKFKSNFSSKKGTFYFGKKVHNSEIYNNVVRQWETKNPDTILKYRHHLLKYRY
jgi:hypothetical protein